MRVIHDEQLARELEQIAKREKRPVEDILKRMVAQYPSGSSEKAAHAKNGEAVSQVHRKLYAKARQYWQSVGDSAKASLSDEELDTRFGAFDEEGVPRLQHELTSVDPPTRLTRLRSHDCGVWRFSFREPKASAAEWRYA